MDVYYLAIAYLTTLRNWESLAAQRVGQALYFYRLVGVVAFELTQTRALLLIFPNTFEYFFIAYEAIRSRWSPATLLLSWWIGAAALIWIVVKLPQEYWIHVAQLDFTDTVREYAWFGPLVFAVIVIAIVIFWYVVRPRLREPDWPWKWAADPLDEEMDSAVEQAAWLARYGRVRSWATLEKMVLLGLLSVIFAQTLPGVRASELELFLAAGVVVVVNAAITLALARRSLNIGSILLAFLARVTMNVVLVAVAEFLLGRDERGLDASATLFFLVLISLITTLHDRWTPVREHRAARLAATV